MSTDTSPLAASPSFLLFVLASVNSLTANTDTTGSRVSGKVLNVAAVPPRHCRDTLGSPKTMARRPASKGLHFFTFLCVRKPTPKQRSLRRAKEGAYVNCWIDFRLHEGALVLAKFYIRQEGWRIRTLESHRWVNGPANAGRGAIKYFREAKRDGASFVFHRYPIRPRADRPARHAARR
jgi:hypothetical protein